MKIVLLLFILLCLFFLFLFIRTKLTKKQETYFEYSKDEKRIKDYGNKLAKMVQFETISYKEHPDVAKFQKFQKLLAKLYPNLFEKGEVIDIDGNLLIKLKGSNKQLDPIMFIGHMDVVEASGKWEHEPFSGDIVDGKLYGRGSGDTKCSLMSLLQAGEEIVKEGYKPTCDVYFGSSCTEEIGGDGAPKIVNYLKKKKVHLYMLSDEGGSIVSDPVAGVKGSFAAIGIFEKGYGDLKFTAKTNGGHSSTPGKNTGIIKLAKFELDIEKHDPFICKFSPAVIQMFKGLAPYCENFWLKLVMVNIDVLAPFIKNLIGKISCEAAAMLKTTIAFTMQKGSDGYNVLPQAAYVTANLRYIPHEDMEASNSKIAAIAEKHGLTCELIRANNPSKELDLNSDQFKLCTRTIKQIFPGVGIMPYVVTGGTDARFYGEICDHCIRFSPVNYEPDQLGTMHGLNENFTIANLPLAVDYFKTIIKAQEERR